MEIDGYRGDKLTGRVIQWISRGLEQGTPRPGAIVPQASRLDVGLLVNFADTVQTSAASSS
jgi:hypothetical protein